MSSDQPKSTNRTDKRAVWHAMQTHLPELAAQMPEITRALGPVNGVKVQTAEQTWTWQK